MRIQVEVDDSSIDIGILKLEHTLKARSAKGLEKVMRRFLSDCLNETPTPPFKTGSMAGSHSIFVGVNFIEDSSGMVSGSGKYQPTPVNFNYAGLGADKNTGTLIVHKPYAASLHEGISHWGRPYNYKTPGSGSHWISSKVLRHAEEYVTILGEVLWYG